MKQLVLIKIGGGLITDKAKPFTIREDMLKTAAEGIARACTAHPEHACIVGNGAGSFGHYLAAQETSTSSQSRISGIHQSVVKLNQIFVEHLNNAGVPAFSVSPSSYTAADNGNVTSLSTQSISKLLEEKFVPVIFGDILPDGTKKGLILSTETVLEQLAEKFAEQFEIQVIYVGETDGVHDESDSRIPEISASAWKDMAGVIKPPAGYDVTGGMLHKIESALRMTAFAKSVYIVSGKDPQNITAALEGAAVGTKIVR